MGFPIPYNLSKAIWQIFLFRREYTQILVTFSQFWNVTLFFRHVRWHGTLSQNTALFSHCVPAMPGPHRGHLRPGHGAISMPHLPGAHHNPAGRGVTIAALVSCQPTPGLDGSAAPWGHSQVFHPSNPGKEKIRLGNPLTFKVIRYFNLMMIDPFVITY